MAGRAVPSCTSDGSYSKVQCYLSTCYCVDENGNQLRGTSVNSLRDGLPDCDDDPGTYRVLHFKGVILLRYNGIRHWIISVYNGYNLYKTDC